MKFAVLVSCMHQKDYSIIENSNIQTDVVVVNQCDEDSINEFDFKNKKQIVCHAVFINTTERGLSKSRNMALRNAQADICLICDDDEFFSDTLEEDILNEYSKHPDVDCITFALDRKDFPTVYPQKTSALTAKMILQTSSQQITFRRKAITEKGILFDEKMGSGTKNGGGEENKLLFDCKKNGLRLLYVPTVIATINKGESQWFHGYDDIYMRNQGWASRRILGDFWGFLYCFFFCFRHIGVICKDMNFFRALYQTVRGFFEKR